MKKISILLLVGLLYSHVLFSGGLVPDTGIQQSDAIFTTVVEEKRKKLEELKKKAAELTEETASFLREIKSNAQEVKNKLQTVKRLLTQDPQNEFYSRQLSLLSEQEQVLKETPLVWEKMLTQIENHIKYLTDYLQDPDLKKYENDLLDNKKEYSFEYFQRVHQWLADQEKKVGDLKEKLKNASVGLESRKRTAAATIEAHEKKQKEFRQDGKNGATSLVFDAQQQAILWELAEALFQDKKRFDDLKIKEVEYKIDVLKTKQFIAQLRQDVIKKAVRSVKSAIQISEADVSFARDELVKKKQESFAIRNRYRQEIEKLKTLQKSQERALKIASKQHNIQLDKELDDWSKAPKDTVQGYLSLCLVGSLNDQLLLTKRKKDLLLAQLAFEEEKMRYQDIIIEVKDSFRKMTSGDSLSEDQVNQEQKKYDGLKAELKATSADIIARQSSAAELLTRQKRALDAIKKRREELQNVRVTIFRQDTREYNQCIELLNGAHEKIRAQIEVSNKIVSTYADVTSTMSKTKGQIDFITSELSRVPVVWHRPEYAITWEGIKNVPADLQAFFTNITSFITQTRFTDVVESFAVIYKEPGRIFWWLIKLTVLILLLFVLRMYIPIFIDSLMSVPEVGWGIRASCLLLVVFLSFIAQYFIWFFVWLVSFAALSWYALPSPYIYVFFYLISIPYLIYLANRFVVYFAFFNKKHDHIFWTTTFQKRFILILSTLLYATVVILFFRQAFMLGNYRRSELPTILLAINFIIFQISLIALIAKELILTIIPTRTETWRFIHSHVDRYYYLILMVVITIIVMSNPYVGFGKLVLYILTRFIYTGLIAIGLFWLHLLFKKATSHIFFSYEQDTAKERFAQSKTWYGLAVIGIFLAFIFIGVLLIAKIWNWPEMLNNITDWSDFVHLLKTPFMLENTENPISFYSVLYILFFIMCGACAAFALNYFVLGRIYDILAVDSGIRNTVSSLTRYLVITTAVILGFKAVGLAALVTYIVGALIIGIGWVIKDPIGDVLAYFIILVQRPLKIGDYVQLDNETMGVVRKITPRSVVIRKKNSNTIVIPNNYVISKPITNWNYVRGFVAFDDIIITISYDADPTETRQLLLTILDEDKYILRHPKPVVRLDNFTEYGYEFMVRGYVSSNYVLDMWDIASDVRLAIVKGLKKHNIEIAVPIRLLYDKKSQASQE